MSTRASSLSSGSSALEEKLLRISKQVEALKLSTPPQTSPKMELAELPFLDSHSPKDAVAMILKRAKARLLAGQETMPPKQHRFDVSKSERTDEETVPEYVSWFVAVYITFLISGSVAVVDTMKGSKFKPSKKNVQSWAM